MNEQSSKETVLPEQKARIAHEIVRMMYSSFPDETLEEMLAIGRDFETGNAKPPDQVLQLNAAIAQELERRKLEAA